MKLVTEHGMVTWLEDTGFTLRRHAGSEAQAQAVIAAGKTVTESNRYVGFNRCVDGRFYFAAVIPKKTTDAKPKTQTVTKTKEVKPK